MIADFDHQVIMLIFFVLGSLVSGLVMSLSSRRQIKQIKLERNSDIAEVQETLAINYERLNTIEKENDSLNQTIFQITEKNYKLERNLAVANQKNNQISNLEERLVLKAAKVDQLIDQNTEFQTKIAALTVQINEERKITNEKIALLSSAKEELKTEFLNLSNSIFDQKTRTFTALNKEKLNNILNPFNAEIKELRKKINDVYIDETKERSSLKTELENLRNLNQKLNTEAINLTRALKGDKKTQGTWGELILENVLDQSGLRKGVEYQTQKGFRDVDNKLLKPDVIIHLPEGKDIVVDSKVSLVDYEKFASSNDETQQAAYLNAHVLAIRNHINSLGNKDYSNLKGIKSLDFILMFIPIEPAFLTAFSHDEKLFSDALRANIIMVTPTTLLATLRTIENIWRYEKQNQNTALIADKASAIYDKFRGFVVDIEKLGRQISTLNTTYDSAFNKLTRGKGNLIGQAQQFVDLGIQVKKEISPAIVKMSDLEN